MTLTQIKPAGLSKPVDLADNEQIRLGTGNDLKIYHSGSNSYIDQTGTGHLFLRGNGTNGVLIRPKSGENGITALSNGAVELFYDNSKKFETTSTGVSVTGKLTSDGLVLGDAEAIEFGNTSNGDFKIYHDGTNASIQNITGNLYLYGGDGAIYLRPSTDDEHGIVVSPNAQVELYHNGSKKFETTSIGINITGTTTDDGARHDGDVTFIGATSGRNVVWDMSEDALEFRDNAKAIFGTGDDLQIYHDGTDSHIQNTNNSGELKIRAHQTDIKNADNNETQAIFHENAAVELYYDNSKKLETTSVGATFSGNAFFPDNYGCQFGNAAGSADLLIYHDGSSNVLQTSVNTKIGKSGEASAWFNPDGAVQLYYDNVKKFETTSGGVNIPSGNLKIPDSGGTGYGRLVVGSGDDLQIYHDGSNSYIKNSTGNLYINGNNTEESVTCIPNGAVKLYYDNSKKFETTSTGISVAGNGVFTGNVQINDGSYLNVGNSGDLQIYHNGSDSYVKNTTGDLYIRDTNGNIFIQPKTDENSISCVADGAVALYHDNVKKFETTSAGVNIGGNQSTNPFDYLRFGASQYGAADIRPTNESSHKVGLSFYTDGTADTTINPTERMRIDSSGNVGIGTTSPISTLHLHEAGATGTPIIQLSNGDTGSTSTDGFAFGLDSAESPFIWNRENTALRFGTNNTERLRIQNDGGISFNGDTAGANALDDYEEGTWTVDELSTANVTITNNTTAKYTKIGQIVHCLIDCTINVPGAGGTDVQLSLPFNSNGKGSGVVGWTNKGRPCQIYVTSNRAYIMDNDHTSQNHVQVNDGDRYIGSFTYIAS